MALSSCQALTFGDGADLSMVSDMDVDADRGDADRGLTIELQLNSHILREMFPLMELQQAAMQSAAESYEFLLQLWLLACCTARSMLAWRALA